MENKCHPGLRAVAALQLRRRPLHQRWLQECMPGHEVHGGPLERDVVDDIESGAEPEDHPWPLVVARVTGEVEPLQIAPGLDAERVGTFTLPQLVRQPGSLIGGAASAAKSCNDDASATTAAAASSGRCTATTELAHGFRRRH